MSNAIFIVGYYRSGTSALSGALSRLGVKFYNEADPNEHNPLGFYEIPELIEYDVDLFNRLGVDWTDVRGLPAGWAERADLAGMLSRLEEILRRRFPPTEALWGLKHPHLCRTLPLYERAARQAGHDLRIAHIFRDPWTAAFSQQHKNGLARAHALLLWMSYVTSAERLARHLPRCWLTYQDLLASPEVELRRLGGELGLDFGAAGADGWQAASSYLTGQLNRSETLTREGLAKPLRALVEETWEAILNRRFTPDLWDEFAAGTADLVGFLTEIGASRGRVIPALAGSLAPGIVRIAAPAEALRPPEREDEGARIRLAALEDAAGLLPRVSVIIAAPSRRAHAVNDTLASLRAQWRAPDQIMVLSADPLTLPDTPCERVAATPGAMTQALCAAVNHAAETADYVAVLNAGDTLTPDACLRFALCAAQSGVEMIYCDEMVPREGGAWVRRKPGWDVTRLRQAAYIGDWVWYGAKALRAAGGLDPARAGAEEYDLQLRLAEQEAMVTRLPEALFTRAPESRRDDILPDEFCTRAAEALQAHLARAGLLAQVQARQYAGLFHHSRELADPGTSIIMLCDGGDIPRLDQWLTTLLTGPALSGPIILAGAALEPGLVNYLTTVTQQGVALEGKVLAVPPAPDLRPGSALKAALALVPTALVAVLDVRAMPVTPLWAEGLRARLADPKVAMAGARLLVPLGNEAEQAQVQGPIVLGADTRLGAGHLPDDPGPGGWLLVDQEASALSPPGLLARTEALRACAIPDDLAGDALWITLGAQLRQRGGRLVWTPDVSFLAPAELVRVDAAHEARRHDAALPWADPYHHPALSLHGDLLAPEPRNGLIRSYPADPRSLLLSGGPEPGACVLNAARALRRLGSLEADWAPERPDAADLGRRAANGWVRVNPARPAQPFSPPYRAVFTAPPEPEALPVLAEAAELYATSPALAAMLRPLVPAGRQVRLWRPALYRPLWADLKIGIGLNTKPRILWVDEGMTPPWIAELMNSVLESASWIVVERAGSSYSGSVSRIQPPDSEYGWAQAMAELGPQILIRPAGDAAHADHYPALLAAAAGCHVLVDERLDLPSGFAAARLPATPEAWVRALQQAIADLPETLRRGQAMRAAALALPSIEENLPPWANLEPDGAFALSRAAE